MSPQIKSTTLLDQVVNHGNELIVPVRHELPRPDGTIRASYTWFTLDTQLVIYEDREEYHTA